MLFGGEISQQTFFFGFFYLARNDVIFPRKSFAAAQLFANEWEQTNAYVHRSILEKSTHFSLFVRSSCLFFFSAFGFRSYIRTHCRYSTSEECNQLTMLTFNLFVSLVQMLEKKPTHYEYDEVWLMNRSTQEALHFNFLHFRWFFAVPSNPI